MGKLTVYSSKEEIPESLREFYIEKGDEFVPNVEGVKTQGDIDRINKALNKEREANEELTKQISKYKDVDLDKWEKVKDLDPDNLPTGKDIDEDSKEFQAAVAKAVREKEKEYKDELEGEYKSKLSEVEQKEQTIVQDYKEGWIKQQLSEQFGFSDPKRLRWLMLDIKAGQHPELKKKLDTLNVEFEGERPKVIGGSLKDAEGAVEVLENIASSDVSKDYKPASDNSGGGTPPNGGGGGSIKENPFKQGDHYNVTKQSQIIRKDKAKAKQLAKEAGWSDKQIEKL